MDYGLGTMHTAHALKDVGPVPGLNALTSHASEPIGLLPA